MITGWEGGKPTSIAGGTLKATYLSLAAMWIVSLASAGALLYTAYGVILRNRGSAPIKKRRPDILGAAFILSAILLGSTTAAKILNPILTITLAIILSIFYTWRRRGIISKLPQMWPANIWYYAGAPFMGFIAWMWGGFLVLIVGRLIEK